MMAFVREVNNVFYNMVISWDGNSSDNLQDT